MKRIKQIAILLLCAAVMTGVVGCRHAVQNRGVDYSLLPFMNEDSIYGYMDTEGEVVIEPRYEYADLFSDGLALVILPTQEFGYINDEGEMIIPPIYSYGTRFIEGRAFVEANEAHFICIDKQGRMLFDLPDCIEVRPFSEEMAPFCSPLGKWGYVNADGEVIYIPTFDFAGDFHEDVATVQMHGRWGIINKEGAYVIEPIYGHIGH